MVTFPTIIDKLIYKLFMNVWIDMEIFRRPCELVGGIDDGVFSLGHWPALRTESRVLKVIKYKYNEHRNSRNMYGASSNFICWNFKLPV